MNYIATRDGVEKYTNDSKKLPATVKQKDCIQTFLAEFSDSGIEDLLEYGDYQKKPTRENASELISTAVEYFVLQETAQDASIYAEYIASRPNSEKVSTHGLFGIKPDISLKDAMAELENHNGNIWTHIVSIRREDAQRLSFDNVDSWINLVRSQNPEIAKQMKIKPENLVWYGAFHNESHHPHVHLMAYSRNTTEGYLTKQGIEGLRKTFATNIFRNDLLHLYKEQTEYRDTVRDKLQIAIDELKNMMTDYSFGNHELSQRFKKLTEKLQALNKGKKVYGYLPKELKAEVDSLLDLFAEQEPIANCYAQWHELKNQITQSYKDNENPVLPISQQKEFAHLKNVIIRNALQELPPELTAENYGIDESIAISIPAFIAENRNSEPSAFVDQTSDSTPARYVVKLWSEQYKECRRLIFDEKNFQKAVELLRSECEQNNPLAHCDLARLYEDGLGVTADKSRANSLYQTALELFISESENSKSDYIPYRIGKMYLYGQGTQKDILQAIQWLEKSADKGNKYAQYNLSMIYLAGNEVLQDIPKALDYLKSSADQKNPYAEYQYGLYFKKYGDIPENQTADKYLRSAYKHFCALEFENADDKLSYRIGKMLEQGLGVKSDPDKALLSFKKSAELKNSHALVSVLRSYSESQTPSVDTEKYLDTLKELAEIENPTACYYLAELYEKGIFLEQNNERAFFYYSQVAQKNPHSEYRMAMILLQDESESALQRAISLLESSCGKGNIYAGYQLGKLLLTEDTDRAITLLENSSNLGNESATYLLGRLYQTGEFVEKDAEKSFQHYSSIAENNEFASRELGRLILDSPELKINPAMGVYWLEHSLSLGNENAYYTLGKEYAKGIHCPQNTQKAIDYLLKSAETKNSFAYLELAKLFLYGKSVPQNLNIGKEYLMCSIDLENPYAEELLHHFNHPKEQRAYQNIVNIFCRCFETPIPPPKDGSPVIVDKKLKSKIKRKKIALGHAKDDGQSMKG